MRLHLWMIALSLLSLTGCGQAAPEDRNYGDVVNEADGLSVPALRRQATICRNAVRARRQEIERLRQQRLALGYERQDSPRAHELDRKMEDLAPSVSILLSFHQVYINKLHAKGEDTHGLEP